MTCKIFVFIDNSARVQTVDRELNPKFHKLINKYKDLTGHGLILNTSFNINREPIVCTPEDALNCYRKTGLDCLIMGNFLIKSENTKKLRKSEKEIETIIN
jgi:carbamoyltransferase